MAKGRNKPRRGVDLLNGQDDPAEASVDADTLVETASFDLPLTSVSPSVRRAVIVEKSSGDPSRLIAIRYDLTVAAVDRIWREFVASTVDVRRLGDENPETFKKKIRKKAANAIENGLDCERDPYRQGALGVAVMKGIGEFADAASGGVRVNVLVNTVPQDWKQRYIGIGSGSEIDTQKGEQ